MKADNGHLINNGGPEGYMFDLVRKFYGDETI